MRTFLISALALGLLLASTGCASNPRVGNGITASERVYGDYGITGSNCNLTILAGSKCTKLSIIGNNNTVTVEENAMLYRVEFWGKGNIVSVPGNLLILRTTEVGANQLIRRPVVPRSDETSTTYYPPPPVESTVAPKGQPTAPPRGTVELKPLPPEGEPMENQSTEEK